MPTSPIDIRPASAVIVLAAGADGVYVRVADQQIGPVSAAISDALTAAAVVDAINADTGSFALVSASSAGPVITLSAVAPGAAGNGLPLDVEAVAAGVAIQSGPCLSGGVSATFSF